MTPGTPDREKWDDVRETTSTLRESTELEHSIQHFCCEMWTKVIPPLSILMLSS